MANEGKGKVRGLGMFFIFLVSFTALFSAGYVADSFSSSSKLSLAGESFSSLASKTEGEALSVDLFGERSDEELVNIASEVSYHRYAAAYCNARATITGECLDGVDAPDRVILAPSLETHENPKGGMVLDCFELLLSSYGEGDCIVGGPLYEEANVGDRLTIFDGSSYLGLTIAGKVDPDSSYGKIFSSTFGSYLIVDEYPLSGQRSLNFDLGEMSNTNAGYLDFLNEKIDLNSWDLRINEFNLPSDYAKDVDSAINAYSTWLGYNGSLDWLCLVCLLVCDLLPLLVSSVLLLKRKADTFDCSVSAISAFVLSYLILQIISSFAPSLGLLNLAPLLGSVVSSALIVLASVIITRLHRRSSSK